MIWLTNTLFVICSIDTVIPNPGGAGLNRSENILDQSMHSEPNPRALMIYIT